MAYTSPSFETQTDQREKNNSELTSFPQNKEVNRKWALKVFLGLAAQPLSLDIPYKLTGVNFVTAVPECFLQTTLRTVSALIQ